MKKTKQVTQTLTNQPRTIRMIGKITTISPVSITTPEVNGMNKDHQGRPYIAGSSIRGKIRSSATLLIQTLQNSVNNPLSVDDIYAIGQGVDTARRFTMRQGSVEINSAQKYRDANRHMSVYGRWGLKGRLSVGNAFSDSPSTLIKIGGSRHHIFSRVEELSTFVATDELDYLSDILDADAASSKESSEYKDENKKLTKQLRLAASQEEKEAIRAAIAANEQIIDDIKKARVGATESILRPLEPFEAIDANVELDHRFVLSSPTQEEFEFFLWCLRSIAFDFSIGGRKAVGCGDVKGSWEVTEHVQGEDKPRFLGTVTIDDNGFNCDIEGINLDAITEQIKSGELDFSKFE